MLSLVIAEFKWLRQPERVTDIPLCRLREVRLRPRAVMSPSARMCAAQASPRLQLLRRFERAEPNVAGQNRTLQVRVLGECAADVHDRLTRLDQSFRPAAVGDWPLPIAMTGHADRVVADASAGPDANTRRMHARKLEPLPYWRGRVRTRLARRLPFLIERDRGRPLLSAHMRLSRGAQYRGPSYLCEGVVDGAQSALSEGGVSGWLER